MRAKVHTRYRLGPLKQVPVGEGRAFDVAGQQVAVFRLRNGSIRALSALCPHRGGPIADGQIDGSVVMCPLHQHQFDLQTGCSTTGQPPLRTWLVEVDAEGDIVVALPPIHQTGPRQEAGHRPPPAEGDSQ